MRLNKLLKFVLGAKSAPSAGQNKKGRSPFNLSGLSLAGGLVFFFSLWLQVKERPRSLTILLWSGVSALCSNGFVQSAAQ